MTIDETERLNDVPIDQMSCTIFGQKKSPC